MRGIRTRFRALPAEVRAVGCGIFVFGADAVIFLSLGQSFGSAIASGLAGGIGGVVGMLLSESRAQSRRRAKETG